MRVSQLLRVLTLGLTLGLAACSDKSSGKEDADASRPVLVAPIRYLAQSQAREFVAQIRPRIESDLGFRVPGKVTKRLVEVGQRVKAGDVLALLDEGDLKLQKEQADAEFAASKVALQQAGADETRAEKLKHDGWVAQAALDRARAAGKEARGRNQRAARAVELARNNLDYAKLRADADGVVTATSVESGQVVAAGAPAIRLAHSGELEALVALPETFAKDAGTGEAKLFLWSAPEKLYAAKLRELSPAADPATRNFAARFSVPGADGAIALGMSATLRIVKPGAKPEIAAPLSALFNQGDGSSLWRVDAENKLELVPVSVLRYESGVAIVSGPLKDGDSIVVLGVHKLQAGQKVRTLAQRM